MLCYDEALYEFITFGGYVYWDVLGQPVAVNALRPGKGLRLLEGKRVGKGPGYEFQMLLGVRGNIRRRLAKAGHRTRIYVPYGERWYEYSMRRLDENPDVAMHITKSIFMPWTNRR